ncbi:universal stress protein [Halostagnicola kamekurae]|uniref:Nucleotide-binding universal stress protein, UspA family n=1 Tax=Halostagnicola kamekurae TaxID=619731 RepID=A0A1I6SWB9_9EURY|nr:universal stress protein [Halostagnicola kamekurae]SFS81183.1 Nucleotide-binding universal stress protein, UspA family [Halostagnicola kamekurae]
MYETLLIPTDGSEESRAAIDHGIALAERLEATVHALSIVPEGPHGAMKRDELRAEPQEEAREANRLVESAAEDGGVDVTSEVREGVPQEAILEYAGEIGADMIVLGTVGRTGLDHVLLGSVAEEIVRNSSVPVVTVQPAE